MVQTHRIVWKEGLFLQPQHFQQAERSLLATLQAQLQTIFPYYWGITQLLVDERSLANNLLRLTRCAGVLADGTVFELPADATQPLCRSFSEFFPPVQKSLQVYVGLAMAVEGRANVRSAQTAPHTPVRYQGIFVDVVDEVFGVECKNIEVGVPLLTLLFEGEELDNYVVLPLVTLIRDSCGITCCDATALPPLLRIGASRWLMDELGALVQLLVARVSALSEGRKQSGGGRAAISSGDEMAFLLLQTLNTWTPVLRSCEHESTIHPHELFRTLSQLAGALCSFSMGHAAMDLPRYEHRTPALCFSALFDTIRQMLAVDIAASCVALQFEQLTAATYRCSLPPPDVLSQSRLYLGACALVASKELVVAFVQRAKLCTPEHIEVLIASAMPGLRLMHVSSPPPQLITKTNAVYFALEHQGTFWDEVCSSGSLALYFPHSFGELNLELLVLRDT